MKRFLFSNYRAFEKCVYLESYFGFVVRFMMKYQKHSEKICSFCPFSDCYRNFMKSISFFQMVNGNFAIFNLSLLDFFPFQTYIAYETLHLLNAPSDDSSNEIWITIPILDIPVTHKNFDLMQNAVSFCSSSDLFVLTWTSSVNEQFDT